MTTPENDCFIDLNEKVV